MKAIEEAEDILEQLLDRAAAAQRDAARLASIIGDIPAQGRWVPLRVKRAGVSRINKAVKLKTDKAYIVKNASGQTISVWTDDGWAQVWQMPALSRLTHVWMPRRKHGHA